MPGYPLHLVPVTRIEFRRMKGRGDGWWKDNYETVLAVFRLFSTQREPEYDKDTDGSPLGSDGVDETGDANRTLVWVTHRITGRGIQTMIGHSRSGQNSRRAAKRRAGVGQPSIVYLKRRVYTETVGGISHGSVPCLRPTDRIVRRLVVTCRRATQIGLRRLSTQKD